MSTTFEWLLLFSPFVWFGWRAMTHGPALPYLLMGFYAYPLYVITVICSPGYAIPGVEAPATAANALRAATHGVAFVVLLCAFTIRRRHLRFPAALGWAVLALVGMLISVGANEVGGEAASRLVITAVVLLNLFVLVPSLVRDDRYFRAVAHGSCFLAVFMAILSIYTLATHGLFPEWSLRLGRPLNPNVLAYLVATALVLSLIRDPGLLVRGFLLLAVAATGSRLAIAFLVLFFLWIGLTSKGMRARTLLPLFIGASVAAGIYVGLASQAPDIPMTLARKTPLSGRERMWAEGLAALQSSPWLGIGDRAYVVRTSARMLSPQQRVHNAFLELAISYGIPVSLCAFLVYIAILRGALRFTEGHPVWARCAGGAVLLFLAYSVLGTASWCNLGDGTTATILMFSVPMAAIRRRRLPHRVHGPAPFRGPVAASGPASAAAAPTPGVS